MLACLCVGMRVLGSSTKRRTFRWVCGRACEMASIGAPPPSYIGIRIDRSTQMFRPLWFAINRIEVSAAWVVSSKQAKAPSTNSSSALRWWGGQKPSGAAAWVRSAEEEDSVRSRRLVCLCWGHVRGASHTPIPTTTTTIRRQAGKRAADRCGLGSGGGRITSNHHRLRFVVVVVVLRFCGAARAHTHNKYEPHPRRRRTACTTHAAAGASQSIDRLSG